MEKMWQERPSPKSCGYGNGWCRELNHAYVCYENDGYVCLTRELKTKWGNVIHCAFRNKAGTDIPWSTKQWIKDSLFGKERVAVEVFPAENRLVDKANMYHLWIFEKGFELPFGIHKDDLSERE